jgi:hypothetical protein
MNFYTTEPTAHHLCWSFKADGPKPLGSLTQRTDLCLGKHVAEFLSKIGGLLPVVLGLACLAESTTLGAAAPTIYFEDFEGQIGLEWSTTETAVTPIGNRRFFGEFGNEAVSLRLSNLPAHDHLTVTFDLFVIRTWDGNNGGPDTWQLSVVDGPVPLKTTFSVPMWGFHRWQAYPGNHPGGSFPAGTGAVELNTLGYLYQGAPADMVFRPTVTFPHTAESATLRFSGANLQAETDESWGIDNVRVLSGAAPRVTFTSPKHEDGFLAPANVALAADAWDSDGAVTQVEYFAKEMYFAKEVSLGSATSAPYSVAWRNAPPGIHQLRAVATDDSGLRGEAYVTIYVNGLRATYFQNSNFTGGNVTRQDPFINFDWGNGPPLPAIGGDTFSVQWSGHLVPRFSEVYTFETLSDDGVRLWVDGNRILDNWTDHAATIDVAQISLEAGVPVPIMLRFYEDTGRAIVRLRWSSASQLIEVIPQSQLLPPRPGVNQRPGTPLIFRPHLGGVSIPPDVVAMRCSTFQDADLSQSHAATDWEIWTLSPLERVWASLDARGSLLTTNHLAGGQFERSHAQRTNLFPNTEYVLRVRHRDTSGDPVTQWSAPAERYFNTHGTLADLCQLLAESQFHEGDDGWRVSGNGNRVVPARNADGFLEMQDQVAGLWYWNAPAKYLGDQTAAYQGFLEFDLRQSDPNVGGSDSQPQYADLIIQGGGRRLILNLSNDPGVNWTHYRVKFDEKSGWRLDSTTGVPPTRSEFIEVLSAITSMQLRGDYSILNTDVTALDKVALFTSVRPTLRISPLVSNNLAIEWPVEFGAFRLESSPTVPNQVWLPVVTEPETTNGFYRVLVRPDASAAFYRLVTP